LVILMKVEIIKVGNLKCNCYLLIKDNKVLVIDPGDEGDKIIEKIGSRDVVGIIITHYHYDHIGAISDIVNKYNVLVYDGNNMNEGENIISNFKFDVIRTPGHKEDLISIYFKEYKAIFCGDFIFKDSIGRCDLEGSNTLDMINSINKIKEYNRDITLYPGHGIQTTLGYEIDNNIYFRDITML